jgi:hypothetical protein
MKENNAQLNLFWSNLKNYWDNTSFQLKARTVLILLYTFSIFCIGWYVGQKGKVFDIYWFADKVKEKVEKDTPGFQYWKSGITYCVDTKGPTVYTTKKVSNWTFQIIEKKRTYVGGEDK